MKSYHLVSLLTEEILGIDRALRVDAVGGHAYHRLARVQAAPPLHHTPYCVGGLTEDKADKFVEAEQVCDGMEHHDVFGADVLPHIPRCHCGDYHLRKAEREAAHDICHHAGSRPASQPDDPLQPAFFEQPACNERAAFLDGFQGPGPVPRLYQVFQVVPRCFGQLSVRDVRSCLGHTHNPDIHQNRMHAPFRGGISYVGGFSPFCVKRRDNEQVLHYPPLAIERAILDFCLSPL